MRGDANTRVISTRIVGKAGARSRQKASERLLEGFQHETYLAQQIVLDKPYAWEYRLTTELLRSKMAPVLSRWRSLSRGLYAKPVVRIGDEDVMTWWGDRLHEVAELTPALSTIMNEEFAQAWGEPGQPGSASEILQVSNLFVENCIQLLDWEERVRFVRLPERYDQLQPLLIGVGGRLIDQVAKAPQEMGRIFADEKPEGQFVISVLIDLPEGWEKKCKAVLSQISRNATQRNFWG